MRLLPFLAIAGAHLSTAHPQPLHGRFIHITDIHPDPYYTQGALPSEACHVPRLKLDLYDSIEGLSDLSLGEDEQGAGRWGNGPSNCDSPISLMNITFDWLEKEWADKVDFVIWTGDNARHDIDRTYPRTPREIFTLNRMVAAKMDEVFTSKGVVVVPSLGNNDIYPHNIMEPGPNSITNEFLNIWKAYIPADQYHVFQRGAYFTSEVIPDKLAVISLNTLYWYDSNKVVDGCSFGSSEPGALEMDWLEVQLEIYRSRGMQVWLSGHVPPNAGNYFPDCWYRYGLLGLRYQDTIVGHTFGHMNVDHFFWIESHSLETYRRNPSADRLTSSFITNQTTSLLASALDSSLFSPLVRDSNIEILKGRSKTGSIQEDILSSFQEIPAKDKIKLKDYSMVNVGPSVIPTYFPSLRVFTYNSTGEPFRQSPEAAYFVEEVADEEDEDEMSTEAELKKKKKKKKKKGPPKPGDRYCRRKKNRSLPICQPRLPRHADKNSPSRKNGFGTPLGYAQFYMPDVNRRSSKVPEYILEYVTYPPSFLHPNTTDLSPIIPLHLLPPSLQPPSSPLTASSSDDDADVLQRRSKRKKYAPYRMKDLTIQSYLKLARQLVDDRDLWDRFLEAMFVGTGREKDEKNFGDGRSE